MLAGTLSSGVVVTLRRSEQLNSEPHPAPRLQRVVMLAAQVEV
jgi:hypothetical protein